MEKNHRRATEARQMQKRNKTLCEKRKRENGVEVEELREQGGKTKEQHRDEMVCFSAANVLEVKSITRGTAGSSSTPQPLFYDVDTATASVFSSVRALTPP